MHAPDDHISNSPFYRVPQATEADVAGVFQIYGDLVGIQRHSGTHQGHPASFSVDFCSIQVGNINGLLCITAVCW